MTLENSKYGQWKHSEHLYSSEIKGEKGTWDWFTGWPYFFLSVYIFWSSWNRSIKILLMPVIYEAVASTV